MNSRQNSFALSLEHITVAYNNKPVLFNMQAHIPHGAFVAIVGPNGAGKTTLLKTILGLIKPLAGSIRITAPHNKPAQIAYVPQRMSVDWDFPLHVIDVVLMGRYQHIGWIRRPQQHDHDVAYDALCQVDMQAYANIPIAHLSGGQQQRVFVARALAQQASLYLLDEPFVGIDRVAELNIVQVLKDRCKEGKTVCVVHHDLATISTYFDWVLLLNATTIACGPVHTMLTDNNIRTTYNTTL